MSLLKNIWTWRVLFIVALILLLWKSCQKAKPCTGVSKVEVKVDTLRWIKFDTIRSKPILIKTEPITNTVFRDSLIYVFKPSANCDSLRQQYDELFALYTNQNEYYDGHWVLSGNDTLAFVTTIDTVAANQVIGKRFTTALYGKQINTTTTITKVEKPRAKGLFGVSVSGTQIEPLSGIGARLGLLTKKNRIYLIGIDKLRGNNQPFYSATYIVPIILRKK